MTVVFMQPLKSIEVSKKSKVSILYSALLTSLQCIWVYFVNILWKKYVFSRRINRLKLGAGSRRLSESNIWISQWCI